MKTKLDLLFFVSLIISFLAIIFLSISLTKEQCVTIENKEVVVDYTNYTLALEHIKTSEGLRLKTYELDGGHYIGYGHKVKKSHPPITEQQADSMLIEIFNQKLFYVSNRYDVTGNQALALAMLFYAVKPSSVTRSVLNDTLLSSVKDSASIVNSWASFCMFQGKTHPKLKKRREFESNLYFKK
jgi:GH24 family phage-related lysozyme (muramidase)